ncbi:MAG: formate dehydrogenase accessory sulfurtransferase FdhD [Candidatus Hydrothermarchaeaceae archaeon]
MIKKFTALRNDGREIIEEVPVEKGARLFVNGRLVANVKLSPGHEEEFAIGYCIGEGVVKDPASVSSIELMENAINVKVNEDFDTSHVKELTSDCISGWRLGAEMGDVHIDSNFTVADSDIIKNMQRLSKSSKNWRKTGGFHSIALVSGDKFLLAEDISRHILTDKIIGIGVRAGVDFKNSYMLTSGRLPGDMVIKVARAGIPIIASRTAPISSGIECAEETGITLIGFARGKRMNIYTHPQRIKIN